MALICGIEEAGRGPVIGPLVMVGVLVDEKDEAVLKNIGVKDSKLLRAAERERLAVKIRSIVKDLRVLIIPPEEVDAAVLSSSINLNWLEALKSAKIINQLKPDKAILDCPSPNCRAYKEYVQNHLDSPLKKMRLIAEHKADVNYPIVSAASILAKVIRDDEVEKLKAKIGINFGSGYMSDPLTQHFIHDYAEQYSAFLRKSWTSYTREVQKKNQKLLADF